MEKKGLKEKARDRWMRTKLIGGAMVAGAAGVVATAGGIAADAVEAEPSALAKFALDLGMTVPQLLLFACFVIALVSTIAWYRTQFMIYLTAGIGLFWVIMMWLGL